jgi:hypothetical protein
MVHLHRGPQAAIVFENIAGTDFVAVDFGHGLNLRTCLIEMLRLLYMADVGLTRQRYLVLQMQKAMQQAHHSYAFLGYSNRSRSVITGATPEIARARITRKTR